MVLLNWIQNENSDDECWQCERIQTKQIEWMKNGNLMSACLHLLLRVYGLFYFIFLIFILSATQNRRSRIFLQKPKIPLNLTKRICSVSCSTAHKTNKKTMDRAFRMAPYTTRHHTTRNIMKWIQALWLLVHSASKSFLKIWQISQWNKITCYHVRQFDLTALNPCQRLG